MGNFIVVMTLVIYFKIGHGSVQESLECFLLQILQQKGMWKNVHPVYVAGI